MRKLKAINDQENRKAGSMTGSIGPVMANQGEPFFFAGVGVSAGGLEALETFFSSMPPDAGIAFIVIQSLSPDYKSHMVELLSKRTAMPVKPAENGLVVEANTVYLIPPKKNPTIFKGKLLLGEPDHSKGQSLPIDVFLQSLADDQGGKAIGIILSGTESDGARGIRAVKERGGMVVVQAEESTNFKAMPRAVFSTELADFILTPERMPEKLVSFVSRPRTAGTELPQPRLSDKDELTRIFAIIRERTKVDFTFYKPSTVVRRIERRMSVNQIEDVRDYVRLLENRAGEVITLYKELLIGVTRFFRDSEVFGELETNYVPKLLENCEDREVRFWVAGCSTGEEAYTLAILARECMERIGKRLDIKLFATDIDRDAIQIASNGIYPESIVADLPPLLLSKYFHYKEEQYQIDRTIREMVVFAQHNLVKDPPFTDIDLLSCRNLLIYLQPVLQYKALEFMNFSLNTDGILILGTSETIGEMDDAFECLHHKFRIYRSRGRHRGRSDGQYVPTLPEMRSP